MLSWLSSGRYSLPPPAIMDSLLKSISSILMLSFVSKDTYGGICSEDYDGALSITIMPLGTVTLLSSCTIILPSSASSKEADDTGLELMFGPSG